MRTNKKMRRYSRFFHTNTFSVRIFLSDNLQLITDLISTTQLIFTRVERKIQSWPLIGRSTEQLLINYRTLAEATSFSILLAVVFPDRCYLSTSHSPTLCEREDDLVSRTLKREPYDMSGIFQTIRQSVLRHSDACIIVGCLF